MIRHKNIKKTGGPSNIELYFPMHRFHIRKLKLKITGLMKQLKQSKSNLNILKWNDTILVIYKGVPQVHYYFSSIYIRKSCERMVNEVGIGEGNIFQVPPKYLFISSL